MNIRFLLGFGCILSVITGCAVGQPKAAESMPLKQIVSMMAESTPISETTLSIKGIEWGSYGIQSKHPPHFSRSGYIHIDQLGKSEISLDGKGDEITSIQVFYYEPNDRIKNILRQNLGSGIAVEELGKQCQIIFSPKRQKIYRIDLENRRTVYVLTDINSSLEPFTTPLQTSFSFYKEIPEYWGCK